MSSKPRTYRVATAHELARASPFVQETGILSEPLVVTRPSLCLDGSLSEVPNSRTWMSREPMEVPAAREYVVREPILIDQGIVLTADGYAVAETLYDHSPQTNATFSYTGNEVMLCKSAVEREESALLLKKKGQTNFGHWLVELLPRLYLHGRANKHPKVFVHAPSPGFDFLAAMYRESIELCCDKVEIIPIPSAPTRVESVRLITGVSRLNAYFSPLAREMAKQMVNAADCSGGRQRLFVSRSAEHGRAMANARDVERFFEDRGFRIVEPSQLSIREQVCLFEAAEEVCGIMGAAMVNAIFASNLAFLGYLTPNYMFSINYPNTSNNPARFYLDMDAALARGCTHILAGPAVTSGNVTPRDEFSIDAKLLERWYKQRSPALH